MAENQGERSKEDLTEEASPYRLEEYRRKGIVSQSRAITGLCALMAGAATAYGLSNQMGSQITEFMREIFSVNLSSRIDLGSGHALRLYFMRAIQVAAAAGLPICIAGFIVGALSSFA